MKKMAVTQVDKNDSFFKRTPSHDRGVLIFCVFALISVSPGFAMKYNGHMALLCKPLFRNPVLIKVSRDIISTFLTMHHDEQVIQVHLVVRVLSWWRFNKIIALRCSMGSP